MNRTVYVNPSGEPAILSVRHPLGIELELDMTFMRVNDTPIPMEEIQPQLTLLPRSLGGLFHYDIEPIDGRVAGRVTVPGISLTDIHGYSIEVYKRRTAANPEDPPVPNSMLAKGTLVLEGGAYYRTGPLGLVTVPVVIGPSGPAGPQGQPGAIGPVGEDGVRGSIWTTGPGVPTVYGNELTGDMYLDEDTGDVYRYDGATWTRGTFG